MLPYKKAVVYTKKSFCEAVDAYHHMLIYPELPLPSRLIESGISMKLISKHVEWVSMTWKMFLLYGLILSIFGAMVENPRLHYCGWYVICELT